MALSASYKQNLLLDDRSYSPERFASNDQINLAVIGSGIQGIYDTTSALRVPGVKLVAACDLYAGRLDRARELWGKDIYVTRDYREILDLDSTHAGIGIFGGFGSTWDRGLATASGYETVVQGGLHSGDDGRYMTVRARGADVAFQNIQLGAPDASGTHTGTQNGKSSYVVHASASTLTFLGVTFEGGNGASGVDGTDGSSSTTTGSDGGVGHWS